MRTLAAFLLVALLLAGCAAPFGSGPDAGPNTTAERGAGTATDVGDRSTDAEDRSTDAAAATDGTDAVGSTDSTGSADPAGSAPDDPPEDVLGWEGGYWANESIAVDASDGFDGTERRAVVNRTMARVEAIRELEYTDSVSVEVISRVAFRNRSPAGGRDRSASFRAFDNAKFESLFLIGEDEGSLSTQNRNRGQNVLGYYSPGNSSIVLVSEAATPRIDPSTLAHELTHALQDQQLNLSSIREVRTRERYNAHNGLIEGEARLVQRLYERRCGAEWDCLPTPERPGRNGNGSAADLHLGVYALNFFPYADGPGFVEHVHEREGWAGVNALYTDLPASTEQVADPGNYGEDRPTNVSLDDTNAGAWERLRPETGRARAAYAVLGQSAIAAMFGYTIYDRYNRSSVVPRRAFLNLEPGGRPNRTDPFNYSIAPAAGWDGDRLHVYRSGASDGNNETAYVWRSVWDSPRQAREFVAAYRELLVHWGGERVSGTPADGGAVWTIREDSPFTDAFRITRDGERVTITNAPTTDELDSIHG